MSVEATPEAVEAPDEHEAVLKKIDTNREKEQFDKEVLETAKEMFQMFDANGDGKLSLDEVREGFAGIGMDLSKEDFDNMIAEIDQDNDGTLTLEEFTKMAARSMEADIDDMDDV